MKQPTGTVTLVILGKVGVALSWHSGIQKKCVAGFYQNILE